MPFRLQGKYIFLTYSQCTIEPDDLLLHLLDICKTPARFIRVCRERHQDGSPHLHAGLRYPTRINVGRESYFDFRGFHPSIEGCRSWPKVLNYLAKDGDTFDYAAEDYSCDDDNGGTGAPAFADAVHDFATFDTWLDYCVTCRLSFGYANAFWKHATRDTSATILDADPPDLYRQFIGGELLDYDWIAERKSYVVSGPTGTGKTSWAKHWAPKPALFISHLDGLKQFNPGFHVSIIFDDVSFAHLPRQSQIHICDFDNVRQIHCRHIVVQIPAGIHKFFTINPPEIVFTDWEPIQRRCIFINL